MQWLLDTGRGEGTINPSGASSENYKPLCRKRVPIHVKFASETFELKIQTWPIGGRPGMGR